MSCEEGDDQPHWGSGDWDMVLGRLICKERELCPRKSLYLENPWSVHSETLKKDWDSYKSQEHIYEQIPYTTIDLDLFDGQSLQASEGSQVLILSEPHSTSEFVPSLCAKSTWGNPTCTC